MSLSLTSRRTWTFLSGPDSELLSSHPPAAMKMDGLRGRSLAELPPGPRPPGSIKLDLIVWST
jgi:hypothetical protein